MDIGHKKIARGSGWHNTGAAIASADYGGAEYEGTVRVFPDYAPSTTFGPKTMRSPREQTCILVRNVSGFAVLPKRLVAWKAGYRWKRIAGYSATTAEEVAGVVDEHWPSTGVPDGEMFWLVLKGHVLCKTDLAGGANNLLPAGTVLVALTGATTGATTAGRVAPIDTTGATTPLANQIIYAIGRATSAKTTGNTDADILVELNLL